MNRRYIHDRLRDAGLDEGTIDDIIDDITSDRLDSPFGWLIISLLSVFFGAVVVLALN